MPGGKTTSLVLPRLLLLIVLVLSSSAVSSLAFLAHPVSAGGIVANGDVVGMVLDPGRPRLYLLNNANNTVDVLNTTSDKIVARVTVGSGLSGLDISQDDSQLYVTLRGTNQLGIINLSTLTPSKPINLTFTPWDVAAGRQGRAYVSHLFDFLFSPVDTTNLKELAAIDTGETGGIFRISQDRKSLYEGYVGIDPCGIDKFNIATDTIPPFSSPPFGSIGGNFGDMALDPDNVHLYVMCAYPYAAQWLNTTDWSLSGSLPTGPYPKAIGLAPAAHLAFTAQGFSDIDAFNTTTRTLLQAYQATGTVTKITALPDGSKFYALISGGRLEAFKPPTWPSNSKLTAPSISLTSIRLVWTLADPSSTFSYKIVGGPTSITVPATTLTYNITRLNPSTKYNFTIYAVSSAGDLSLIGPSVTATTLADTIPPSWPQGSSLTAYNITPISLTLTWTTATDNVAVTNYRVYSNKTLVTATGNTTTTILTGLKSNTTYNFQVQAGDLSNNWSTNGPANTVHTPAQPNPGQYGIYYRLSFPASAYPGSTTTFVNNFTNTGTTQIWIQSISIFSRAGTFAQGNLSIIIQPSAYAIMNNTITIPVNTYPNSYLVTSSVVWQYLDPVSGTWLYGASDPLVVSAAITILKLDFMLTATPPSLTITHGSTGMVTVGLVTPNGVPETVTLSGQTTLSGLTVNFNPNLISSGRTSAITISVDNTVPPGTYDLVVIGTNIYGIHTLSIIIIVPGPVVPDFSINPAVTSVSFDSGSSFKTSFSIAPTNGFTGPVTLTLSDPSNISCSLDRTSVQTSGTTTLSCAGSTMGDYVVRITATIRSISHQATITVHVAPSPALTTNSASLPILGINPMFLVELAGGAIALVAIAGLAIVVVERRRRP